MLLTTGRVNGRRIEIDDEQLPEGATVTILAPENGEIFDASPDEEARLLSAIAEAESGTSRGDAPPLSNDETKLNEPN